MMKTTISRIGLTILAFASLTDAYGSTQSDSTQMTTLQERIYFNLEVGTFFSGSDQDAGWGNPFGAHASVGIPISSQLLASINFDYYQYFLGGAVGEHSYAWSPSRGRRDDFALYTSVSLAGTLIAGVGAYHTKSDSAYLYYWLQNYKTPMAIGGIDAVRFFVIVGAYHEFHLVGGWYLPVGIYVRQSYGDRYGPAFLRSGFQFRF